jgi:hypothetical protein
LQADGLGGCGNFEGVMFKKISASLFLRYIFDNGVTAFAPIACGLIGSHLFKIVPPNTTALVAFRAVSIFKFIGLDGQMTVTTS